MEYLKTVFSAIVILLVESCAAATECGETGSVYLPICVDDAGIKPNMGPNRQGFFTYPKQFKHGIVFDAGSSSTSMFIFNWPDNKTDGTGRVEEISDCDVEGGGISDYVDNPEKAGESLEDCLQIAIETIDKDDHEFTPVYLGSTAGMRLVEYVFITNDNTNKRTISWYSRRKSNFRPWIKPGLVVHEWTLLITCETNPTGSAAIFDSVRETLANTPFNFSNPERQARIISGGDEGVFGWVTTNYLSNRFKVGPTMFEMMVSMVTGTDPAPKTTYGALDLGGASTQLSFVPEKPDELPEEYRFHKRLYGYNYDLYSNSFLCYGANEAQRRLEAILLKNASYSTEGVNNPCLHTGENVVLDGNYLWKAPCSKGPQAMAGWGSEVTMPEDIDGISYDTEFTFNGTGNPEECANYVSQLFNFSAPCEQPPCSFNGVHQPKPYGNFIAFSAFYHVIDALTGTTTPTIADIDTAKVEFCQKSRAEVMSMPNYNKYYLTYCFKIHYVRTILIDGYGFDESTWNIEFVKKVNDASVGWTMGYMIDATNRIPSESDCTDEASVNSQPQLSVLICSLLVTVIGFNS